MLHKLVPAYAALLGMSWEVETELRAASMAETFTGQCVGGPLDGQKLAHWAKIKAFYRPIVNALAMNIDDAPVETISIGEYHLNDYGQWHWWGTDTGRAHDVLYGTKDQK